MKLQADRIDGQNAIARHGPDGVLVNGVEYTHSVIVPWEGTVQRWPVSKLESLRIDDFESLIAMQPQVVIFGSGAQLRFPPASVLAGLMKARIGFETMDNAAACRTYNVLLAEGRAVIAALLFG
ncbi:MAG: Mth938-like domain-containing protein [Ideonella sp.]